MGRIMALDYGQSRIGIAVSDEMQIISSMPERAVANNVEVFKKLGTLIKKYEIERLVVGAPQGLQGQSTESTLKAKEFGEQLKKHFSLPVEHFDERFSTQFSQRILDEQNISHKEKKENIDNQAAQIILQDYLQSRSGENK